MKYSTNLRTGTQYDSRNYRGGKDEWNNAIKHKMPFICSISFESNFYLQTHFVDDVGRRLYPLWRSSILSI